MMKSKFIENALGITAIVVLIVGVGTSFGEEYHFTNSLPANLEIKQNDTIVLKNLTNSTIVIRHTEGIFSSSIGTNGTWTGNFPYDVGEYPWKKFIENSSIPVDSGTIYIKSEIIEPTVTISGNHLEGNVGNNSQNIPVAVTTISPKFEAESIVVKTSTNGDFETILDLDEIGTHDVIVSHDGKSIGKFSQQVTEENVREYAGIDILEIRLAILETLERILEVLFGK
tara:strand:- start:112 stop:792 length:681 start_codon:yes stop_codon:yes gene_type:complete